MGAQAHTANSCYHWLSRHAAQFSLGRPKRQLNMSSTMMIEVWRHPAPLGWLPDLLRQDGTAGWHRARYAGPDQRHVEVHGCLNAAGFHETRASGGLAAGRWNAVAPAAL